MTPADDSNNALRQVDDETEVEQESQTIVLLIDTEEYGVDALRVQEIIRYVLPVKVPNAPDPIQGVINFRGEVIPVVDLRKTFGLSPLVVDQYTVIVIVVLNQKIFGMAADRVLDIINIPVSKINEASDQGFHTSQKYIRAMVKVDNRLILLLDLEKIVSFETENQPSGAATAKLMGD